jgi:ribosomal protein S18 acetylase RimI-like enzyme
MELSERLEFGHQGRRDVYEYVESHGPTRPAAVRRALGMDERAFGHHRAILKRDGLLEDRDGRLRLAYDAGAAEEYATGEVEFTIRQARESDLTGLVGAIRDTIGGGEYVAAETVADVVEHEGVLLRHNDLESRIFFVATVGDEVVGWVHLKHPELGKLAHTVALTVGVLSTYRGHGIGSHLLERGHEWAADQGYEKVSQSVPASNEGAIEFLRGRGYETEAVREDHYRIDGEYVDEVMLARRL